jgi:hypothetical protein
MAILFHNGAPAKMAKGRYQTRNNRVVEITGSHIESGTLNGVPFSKTMWDGVLYQADGKTVETPHTWSDAGTYLHEQGVMNQFDIATVTSQEPEPMNDAAPAVLENQLLCAALTDQLAPLAEPGETPLCTLERVIRERNLARAHVKELLAQPVA